MMAVLESMIVPPAAGPFLCANLDSGTHNLVHPMVMPYHCWRGRPIGDRSSMTVLSYGGEAVGEVLTLSCDGRDMGPRLK
ncbi:hypothetical protein GUJ93_ZPchr0013g36734 [Zizania palustris]|uniref:Uncharacterized protein n=1 Tax=Zizania palustris TaxID=103762 RepID=A0A8J6BXA2_ZIZPA|nr:hypothetical protein GUJ93_ZPchr0013g36734 [Zizania palustris]